MVASCIAFTERNLYSVAPPFTREAAPYKRQRVLFLTTRKKYGQTFPRAKHHRPLSMYGKGSILNCVCLESRRNCNLHTDLQYLFFFAYIVSHHFVSLSIYGDSIDG